MKPRPIVWLAMTLLSIGALIGTINGWALLTLLSIFGLGFFCGFVFTIVYLYYEANDLWDE